jgi:hypothetical protein
MHRSGTLTATDAVTLRCVYLDLEGVGFWVLGADGMGGPVKRREGEEWGYKMMLLAYCQI